MKRRTILSSLLSLGVVSFLGKNLFSRNDTVRCKIEDFWDTVRYEKEWDNNGNFLRNIYRIEDYPICSVFNRIKFKCLRKDDHFIMISSDSDYMGPNSSYGFISKAESNPFGSGNVLGVQSINIKSDPCWAQDAFEKHMIKSGIEYVSSSGHYKNGVRIG